jgi:predicted RNA binding protein YcfA (HicA-like mRNA interferase family)
MSHWPSVKAKRLLAALIRIGWTTAWQNGSHRRLQRPGWPNYIFAFHDSEEIGPALLGQIAKKTGLRPEDLWQLLAGPVAEVRLATFRQLEW